MQTQELQIPIHPPLRHPVKNCPSAPGLKKDFLGGMTSQTLDDLMSSSGVFAFILVQPKCTNNSKNSPRFLAIAPTTPTFDSLRQMLPRSPTKSNRTLADKKPMNKKITLKLFALTLTAMSVCVWGVKASAQVVAAAVSAQKPAPVPLPQTLINPWRVVGIDGSETAKAKNALTKSQTALVNATGQNPQTLTELATAAGKLVTINMKKISDKIISVTGRTQFPFPVIIEPVWCSVADQHVILVTIARTDNNELLGSAHSTIFGGNLKSSLQGGGDLFTPLMSGLLAKAQTAAQARASQPKVDALHVGLSVMLPEHRRDTGSGQCLNYIAEERLAKDYTVARFEGADRLVSLRSIFDLEAKMRRPTRIFTMQWQQPDPRKPQLKMPLNMQLKANVAESVFGHSTPRRYAGAVPVSTGQDRTINLNFPSEFQALFSEEKSTLLLADWPQVAKIYGAWVYLDRGRAWGLNMNDRMMAMVDGKPVKGHVVRFFGPEQKLMSPRGFPIEEGAILYIRKGQKLPTKGLEFQFDPRQFPTTYPIQPGN